MTNLDAIIETASQEIPGTDASKLPRRHGLWRIISLLAVAAALVVTTMSVLQSRNESDVAVPERDPVALADAEVTVVDIAVPTGSTVSVLGLAQSQSQQDFSTEGATVGLPDGMPALVALNDSSGDLIGLAVVPRGEDRAAVQISPTSTAQAVLLLSPGILRPDLAESYVNTEVVESDPAFDKLVQAIQANPNLSRDNESVEQAYAEIADRLPARRPAADQGCDSVIARDAYTSAGACVQPETTGLRIANEQDRWALIFNEPNDFAQVCAAISPTGIEGSDVLIPSEQCTGNALMVAPGPVPNLGTAQAIIDERVRTAVALNQLYEYAGPFADLAGSSTGYSDESVLHLRRNAPEVADALAFLIETNEAFAAAMDLTRMSSTALDRHNAAITAARHIVEAADTTAIIPQRVPGDQAHIDILDFFVRAGERMVSPRTDWRWEADAADRVDFGTDS